MSTTLLINLGLNFIPFSEVRDGVSLCQSTGTAEENGDVDRRGDQEKNRGDDLERKEATVIPTQRSRLCSQGGP